MKKSLGILLWTFVFYLCCFDIYNSFKISSNEDKYRLLIYYRNDQLLSTEPYINQTIDVCVAQREEAARDNAAFETLRRRREQGNINARRFSPGKAKRVANGGIEYSVSLFIFLKFR